MRPMSITIDQCVDLALCRGGKCLSTEYVNSFVKLEWECEIGHRWQTTFYSVRNGHWCPYCAKCKKSTIEQCIEFAKTKNGECLSPEYINNATRMMWKCKNGHEWLATYNSIKSGKWCLRCARKAKHTIEDCIIFAENKLGRCLSNKYINSMTRMEWECRHHHKWLAAFNSVKNNNTWCPECSRFKTQKLLKNICEEIFNTKIILGFRGFDWLKSKKIGPGQEIDIWIPKYKIAIEYDGEQHFRPIKCFGGEKKFVYTKMMDKIKNKKIKSHSKDIKYFVRFNYTEPITKKYVIEKLTKGGIIICKN